MSYSFCAIVGDCLLFFNKQTDAVHSKATGSSTINTAYDRLSTEPMGIEAVSTSRQTQGRVPGSNIWEGGKPIAV